MWVPNWVDPTRVPYPGGFYPDHDPDPTFEKKLPDPDPTKPDTSDKNSLDNLY